MEDRQALTWKIGQGINMEDRQDIYMEDRAGH